VTESNHPLSPQLNELPSITGIKHTRTHTLSLCQAGCIYHPFSFLVPLSLIVHLFFYSLKQLISVLYQRERERKRGLVLMTFRKAAKNAKQKSWIK